MESNTRGTNVCINKMDQQFYDIKGASCSDWSKADLSLLQIQS